MRYLAVIFSLLLVSPSWAALDSQELFNGHDLGGWQGDPQVWTVTDGLLTGQTKTAHDIDTNTFLVWKGFEVDDFELHVVFRLDGPNSGVQYRSHVNAKFGPFCVVGYQADIHTTPNYTGMLYEEGGRKILAERGQKVAIAVDGSKETQPLPESQETVDLTQWNELDITAIGNHLVHKLNGKVTVDVTDNDAKHAASHGILALQVSSGPPIKVQFKSIRLKRLSEEKVR